MHGSPWGLRTAIVRTGCDGGTVLRWLLVLFLALMFISWLSPLLRRLGFGRLPGDLRFRWLGRDWDVPLASTLLLSFVLGLLVKWL